MQFISPNVQKRRGSLSNCVCLCTNTTHKDSHVKTVCNLFAFNLQNLYAYTVRCYPSFYLLSHHSKDLSGICMTMKIGEY